MARRFRKKPDEMLLDRVIHHSILKGMPDSTRRGRPDIVHLSILSIADTPAYRGGLVDFILHTIKDLIIVPKRTWRPPRNYYNFVSIFEQLLKIKRIPPEGEPILVARQGNLAGAIKSLSPKRVVLFSSRGRLVDLHQFFRTTQYAGCVYLIGAYAKGEPRKSIVDMADDVISIYPKMLPGWVVASRAVYELEKASASSLSD